MWKIWCELPQMSKAPGALLSGHRTYFVRVGTRRKEQEWTYRIKDSTKDIHGAVENNPAKAHSIFQTLEAIDESSVDDRNNT